MGIGMAMQDTGHLGRYPGESAGAIVFNHTDTNLQYSMPLSGQTNL